MSKLLVNLLICIVSVTTFPANAANKNRTGVKKSQIAPVQKPQIQKSQKPADDAVGREPLSGQNLQSQVNQDQVNKEVQVNPVDVSPPKPTEVNYTPPPNFNDRNPISN